MIEVISWINIIIVGMMFMWWIITLIRNYMEKKIIKKENKEDVKQEEKSNVINIKDYLIRKRNKEKKPK
jgi:type III secretory pathway component EscR